MVNITYGLNSIISRTKAIMENNCKFVVVLRLLTLLMFCGCITGDVNSGSIYSLLSHVIFEMKANFEKVDKRMEIMEDRLGRVETAISSTVAKTSDISDIRPNDGIDLNKVDNFQALAIKKTLFTEKKILREAMHSFAQNFSDFKSEILTEMTAFSKALNMNMSTINASLESKADNLIYRLNSSSISIAKEVTELTSSLKSTSSKISHVLQEVKSSIEGVEQRITAVENEQKIDGGWNAWAAWTSCTVTCNSGFKTRQRQCANPRPSGGGQYCDGTPTEVVECNQNSCPEIDGGWNAWAAWTSCTVTCNSGLKTRQRQCSNPRPSGGGQYCDGAPTEVVECNQNSCPKIDGGWNAWAAWTPCTATCNSGLKTRQRHCANPRPSGGGQYCEGAPIDVVECNQNRCPRAKSSFTAKNATRLSTGVLSFLNVQLNEGSNFDGSSGTFTGQHSGLYFFTASVVEGGISDNSVSCNIRRNDSDQVELRYLNPQDSTNKRTSNGYGAATGSATLHLTNGDRVNVYCHHLTLSVSYSSFTGFLIAEDP